MATEVAELVGMETVGMATATTKEVVVDMVEESAGLVDMILLDLVLVGLVLMGLVPADLMDLVLSGE